MDAWRVPVRAQDHVGEDVVPVDVLGGELPAPHPDGQVAGVGRAVLWGLPVVAVA